MPTPPFHGAGGRRMLLFFSIAALVLVLAFLGFAGVAALYFVRNGKAQVSDTLPSNLPREVPICVGFVTAHVIIVNTSPSTRYEISGDCPENRLTLVDDMTSEMEYGGWTVMDDGQGNLSGYFYSKHERIDIVLADSTAASNQTTVTMTMVTAVDQVPPGFPSPPPSPRP